MAANAGRLFLLKKGAVTIANCRSKSIRLNGDLVDITNDGSTGFVEMLAGAGNRSAVISCEGIFTDDDSQNALITDVLANTSNAYTMTFVSGDTIGANFIVSDFSTGGAYNEGQPFSATLSSDGTVTFIQA